MKRKYLLFIFILWITLWSIFFFRGLFVKGKIGYYKTLLTKSIEGKRSYVTGDRLYDFIIFCINSIPADASYQIVGFTDDSVENRYAVYYLYPHLEKPDPDFILFFDYTGQPEALTSGYDRYASLDKDRYIMKKRGAR